MSRVVDVRLGGVRRFAVSPFRREAAMLPLAPLRREFRRVFGPVPRSRRLPWYPGCRVPVIAIRGVRYVFDPHPHGRFWVVRGWMTELR